MDVAAAVAACVTPADHYRRQLRAENRLAPAEVAALAAGADALPEPAQAWIERLMAMCRRVAPGIEAYRRHDLAPSVSFYEGQGPAARSLVVCFTGVAQRMTLPIAPFLQALPASRCNVVVLRDPMQRAFIEGVPGYAADLPALAARLARDIPAAWNGDRCCVGASSGSAAALAFASLAGARLGLGLGGVHPAEMMLRRAPEGIDRQVFDRLLADSAPGAARLILAYGLGSERDALHARRLAATVPGVELLGVMGVAVHGLLPDLLQQDRVAAFLGQTLLGDAPVNPPPPHCPG